VKVTFLGTGTSQGVPVIACECAICTSADPRDNRLRTSVMVEVNGKVIVIDSGPDFRYQMLRAKVHQLDAILFTHEHKDHIAGLDDVRAFNFKHDREIDVYAEERVQTALKSEFSYIFSGINYPGLPRVILHGLENKSLNIQGVDVHPIRVMHYKLPVFGFRIGDFTYITDAKSITEEEKEKMKGSKVLVLNALRREDHISHFTLQEAIDLAKEIGAEQTYLTHISHQLGLHTEVEQELPEGVYLAYDGLCLVVGSE
jgi:phosphoribosyl 1,2-cyclic phosphate phosphodiesterase